MAVSVFKCINVVSSVVVRLQSKFHSVIIIRLLDSGNNRLCFGFFSCVPAENFLVGMFN